MREPAKIDTPYPSIEETARLFRVPQSRVEEIVRSVERNGAGVAARSGKPQSAPGRKKAARPRARSRRNRR
jgi:hypothetical protein